MDRDEVVALGRVRPELEEVVVVETLLVLVMVVLRPDGLPPTLPVLDLIRARGQLVGVLIWLKSWQALSWSWLTVRPTPLEKIKINCSKSSFNQTNFSLPQSLTV